MDKPAACAGCPLEFKGEGFVKPEGDPSAQVVLVGEAPGEDEVAQGRPFIGKAGSILSGAMNGVGMRRTGVYITNALKCRPHLAPTSKHPAGQNRTPTVREITECRERHLQAELRALKPTTIVALGEKALQALTGRTELMSTPKRPGWWQSILSAAEVRAMQKLDKPDKKGKVKGEFVWPTSEPKLSVTIHPSAVQKSGFAFYDVFKNDLHRVVSEQYTNTPVRVPVSYHLGANAESVKKFLDEAVGTVAFDLETTRDLNNPRITMIGLSTSPTNTIVTGWNAEIGEVLRPWLADPSRPKAAHNAAFDVKVLLMHGFEVRGPVWDTMIGANLMFSHLNVGLAFVGPFYTDMPQWKQTAADDEPLYCAKDVDATKRIEVQEMASLSTRSKLGHAFIQHALTTIMPARRIFTEMEMTGIRIDEATRDRLRDESIKREAEVAAEWERECPGVNYRSSKQKIKFFFTEMGLKPKGRTKGGAPSFKKEVLEKLLAAYPDVRPLQILGELQRIGSIRESFIEIPTDSAAVYHPTYKMHKSRTGRLAGGFLGEEPDKVQGSRNNVMNVPEEYRTLYIPHTEGNIFLGYDFKTIEFAITAAVAHDTGALKAYAEGDDIHWRVACRAYGIDPTTKPTKEDNLSPNGRRFKAKKVVHGGNYGAGAKKVSEVTGLPLKEATALLNGFLAEYPMIATFRRNIITLGKRQKWLENPYGRRCWFPEGNATEMLAFIPQSTAVDVALERLVWLWEAGIRPCTFTHDSFLIEVRPEEAASVNARVIEILQRPVAALDGLSIGVEVKMGTNWGEMKEWK